MENYDPMREFWRWFFPFLFKQMPVTVFMTIAVAVMWFAIVNLKAEGRAERIEIRKECAASVAEMREELRHCIAQKDTLIRENIALNRRVAALEARLRR